MKRERSPASPGIDPAFLIGNSLPCREAHFRVFLIGYPFPTEGRISPHFPWQGEEKNACMVAKPIVVSGDEGISVKFDKFR